MQKTESEYRQSVIVVALQEAINAGALEALLDEVTFLVISVETSTGVNNA